MTGRTAIDAATVRAYRETEYRVDGAAGFVLRVGAAAPALAALYRARAVASAAFVTACNPHSRPLDAAENGRRQAALAAVIAARGWEALAGSGRHPAGSWPAEASFLVLGISLEDARALGRRFEQNALVWCGPDALARLELLS